MIISLKPGMRGERRSAAEVELRSEGADFCGKNNQCQMGLVGKWRFQSSGLRSAAEPSGGLRDWRNWQPRLWGRQLQRRKIWRAKPSERAIVEAVGNSKRNINECAIHVRWRNDFHPIERTELRCHA